MSSVEHTSGLLRNKRHAIIAVILTAIIAASALGTTLQPMRLTSASPWLFEPIYGVPHLRLLFIGLSVFFWVFVLWILFWFYGAARGKYERFLLGSFATGFVLSTIERFMSPHVADNMQYLSTAAALVSLVFAIAILFTLPSKTTMPE
jgi:uncharacterized BrkB/YihY/UPF0761 family membrane protein